MMDFFVEYYDEIFPVTETQKKFYESYLTQYPHPAKFLSIGCGTGVFEHRLAKDSVDVTGIETIRELLESATRKYRNQLMSLRYFQMSTLEMTKFLGKKFYNIISCLNSRIVFIREKEPLQKFFSDCKELLSDGGVVILGVTNFAKFQPNPKAVLPQKESIRVKYKSQITKNGKDILLESRLEKDGKNIPVYERVPIYALQKEEIETFAKTAGFSKIEFFADFEKTPFTENADNLIAVLS